MILKMWVKSKFVLRQPRYYNLLTEKMIRESTALKYSFFRKRIITVTVKKLLSNTIFRWYILKYFQLLANSVILVKDWIKLKRGFEKFLIDPCAADFGNKNIAGKYLNILVLMSPTLYKACQFTQVTISIIS